MIISDWLPKTKSIIQCDKRGAHEIVYKDCSVQKQSSVYLAWNGGKIYIIKSSCIWLDGSSGAKLHFDLPFQESLFTNTRFPYISIWGSPPKEFYQTIQLDRDRTLQLFWKASLCVLFRSLWFNLEVVLWLPIKVTVRLKNERNEMK